MKKKTLALMSAIALTGMLGFSSCSTSEEEVVNNPNYNPETNEVVTKFVFNVSTGNTPTRQSSAATQATAYDYFRGIDNCVLYSLKGSVGEHVAAATKADKRYDMSQILAPNTIDENKSNRIIETSLPLNTTAMLFYGKAIQGNAYGYLHDSNCEFGKLDTYELPEDNDLSKVTFGMGKRLNSTNQEEYHKVENILAGILTVIMNTNLAGGNHVGFGKNEHPNGVDEVASYGYDVTTEAYPEVTWADYANADGKSPVDPSVKLKELERKLANVYREMTNITEGTGELRAGSGKAIQLVIHDLWENINEVRCATPTDKLEAVAKFLAANIHSNLLRFFTNSYVGSDGHGLEGVDYLDVETIVNHLNHSEWPANSAHSTFENVNIDLIKFPTCYDIPFGAAHLRFDKTAQQFSYVQDYNTSLMGDDITTISADPITVEDYCYPPELLYFGNGPLRVTNQEKMINQYPNGVANWDSDDSWSSDWSVGHVSASTQAVAMKNDVNYGTALLKTTVRYGTTQLKDNNHAIQKRKNPDLQDEDEPDNTITVGENTFQLTGIIIGGMPQRVGWDFIPKAGAKYHSYVYDHAIVGEESLDGGTSIPASTEQSTPANYTLTFDNYKDDAHQDKVYVALEFLNNSGMNFFGEHNMIRNNTHFYLIGELDPEKEGLTTIKWPEEDNPVRNHPLPPYDVDGTSKKVARVFMQDYMTSADFVIGANSLKHALLTVPDLRYSSMTLGLSVDIKWSTGLDFTSIILGGN